MNLFLLLYPDSNNRLIQFIPIASTKANSPRPVTNNLSIAHGTNLSVSVTYCRGWEVLSAIRPKA